MNLVEGKKENYQQRTANNGGLHELELELIKTDWLRGKLGEN